MTEFHSFFNPFRSLADEGSAINGNGYSITGNIYANKSGSNSYTPININNTTINGDIYAYGGSSGSASGYNGSYINLKNSNITGIYSEFTF